MKKQLFENSSPADRVKHLFNGADKVEEFSYMKRFKTEEIDQFKTELSEIAISLDAIDQEREVIKEEFKLRTKPLEKDLKRLLQYIRDKATSVKEKCAVMYDHERGMTEYYNEDGELVYSRPMMADERQKTIFSLPKEGTND